jgi:hypothetical protein
VLVVLAALAFLVYDAAQKPLRPPTLMPAPPDTLNARELVLRDAEGRPRVVAKADDAPALVMLDAGGNEVARIGAAPVGQGGRLPLGAGAGAVVIDTDPVRPSLALQDGKGRPRLTLLLSEAGPAVVLSDAEGVPRRYRVHASR